MRDVVICEPRRTAVGAFGGSFKDTPPHHLASAVVKDIVERTKLNTELVEDVLFANCYPTMEAPALGRVVALDAGLPISAGGLQIDRRCGSGLQAIIYGAMQVGLGGSDMVIAGGAESMSRAPFYTVDNRWGVSGAGIMLEDGLSRGRVTAGGKNYPVEGGMIETAENLRRDYQITRDAQDELAARSHARADAAREDGRFAQEIVPVTIRGRKEDKLSTRTNTFGPGRVSRSWPNSGRSAASRIPSRQSRRAMRPVKMMAPRRVS